MKVICVGEYLEDHHSPYFHSYGFSDNVSEQCSDVILFTPDYTEILGEKEPFLDGDLLNESSSRELLRRIKYWKDYLESSVNEGAIVIVNCIGIRPIYVCDGNSAVRPIKINNYSFFDEILSVVEVTSSAAYKKIEVDWGDLFDCCRPEVCLNFDSEVLFKPFLYSEDRKEIYSASCKLRDSKGNLLFLPSFDLYRDFDVDANLELTRSTINYQEKLLNNLLKFCITNRCYFERRINEP